MADRTPKQQQALQRLEPWQRQIAEAVLDGRPLTVARLRQPGKDRLAVFLGAAYELEGRRWDYCGTDPERARRLRRQARELAAQLSKGQP
jgi:hypothetical protein